MIYLVEDIEIEADEEKQAAEIYAARHNMKPYQQMKVMVDGKPFTVFTYPNPIKRR